MLAVIVIQIFKKKVLTKNNLKQGKREREIK